MSEKIIKKMRVGEFGYTVPWAVAFDDQGRTWLRMDYSIHQEAGGTVKMFIYRDNNAKDGFNVHYPLYILRQKTKSVESLSSFLTSDNYVCINNRAMGCLKLYVQNRRKAFMKRFSGVLSEDEQEEVIRELIGFDLKMRQETLDAKLDEQYSELLHRVGAQYVGDRK